MPIDPWPSLVPVARGVALGDGTILTANSRWAALFAALKAHEA
jgi:hypothetical protein